jgi:hypothetical protein
MQNPELTMQSTDIQQIFDTKSQKKKKPTIPQPPPHPQPQTVTPYAAALFPDTLKPAYNIM